MHEVGVVFHILDAIEEVLKENDLTRVGSVTLQIGEVSGIVPSYLDDVWGFACSKHDFMVEGAKLIQEPIHAVTYCEDCQRTYDTVEHGKTCPHCGSGNTYLLRGNEVLIKEIEAE